jgi:hypothetical protein
LSWSVFGPDTDDPDDDDKHVVPNDDLRMHALSRQCWCKPWWYLDDDIVVHNSLDGREKFERNSLETH